MAWRFLRSAPFLQHVGRDALQLIDLLLRPRVGDEFEAMPVGIKEINRLEYAVIRRADHVETLCFNLLLRLEQRVVILDLERDVLHPFGRVLVAAHLRSRG